MRPLLPALLLFLVSLHAAPAVALDEVPFITTPDNVTTAMLDIARVGPRDHVIDLGSGDGRIVITAARRYGASGLGVEIDPALVERSNAHAVQAGVAARVQFREQDLFKTDLSAASVITMYLLPDVNLALRPALLALKPGTRIVSHDWDMADWAPDRTRTLDVPDKKIGREKISRVHLWIVPAPVAGLWCGPRRTALQIDQQFQHVLGRAVDGRDSVRIDGRLDGTRWQLSSHAAAMQLTVDGRQARVTQARGAWAGWRGWSFSLSTAQTCPA